MKEMIIRSMLKESKRAFEQGMRNFRAYGKEFRIENVRGNEYRCTTVDGTDAGIRLYCNGEFVHAALV